MQSTYTHGARAKTSITRTSSTSTEDRPHHISITIDGKDCNVIMVNHQKDDTPTQPQPPTERVKPGPPLASQSTGTTSTNRKRSYAGKITEVKIFPDTQAHHSTLQHSEAHQHDQPEGKKETPWTPHQTYDNKGCANFHQNSEGIVVTTPSGHPLCGYCRIPSHPRSTCQMRIKHLAQNIDRLYHPEKGVVLSNNQRRQRNKLPNEEQVAKHNIAGTSKIKANNTTVGTTSPTKKFRPPNDTQKYITEVTKSGIPNYWSTNGQLVVSQQGDLRCNYCVTYYPKQNEFADFNKLHVKSDVLAKFKDSKFPAYFPSAETRPRCQ